MEKTFPTLNENQVALLRVDLYTGIKQDINCNNVTSNDQEIYSIYNSVEEALLSAEKIVEEYDFVECYIYDKNKNTIKFIQPK